MPWMMIPVTKNNIHTTSHEHNTFVHHAPDNPNVVLNVSQPVQPSFCLVLSASAKPEVSADRLCYLTDEMWSFWAIP